MKFGKMTRIQKQILECLVNPEFWKPDTTKISKVTGYPLSTVHDNLNKILKDDNLNVDISISLINII